MMPDSSFPIQILLGISSLLGVHSLPTSGGDWIVNKSWTENGSTYVLEASSQDIVQQCNQMGDTAQIVFPGVIHASHQAWIDGRPILLHGDPDFKTVRSFYGAPTLPCSLVKNGHQLTWRVSSYSRYFSRIHDFPKVVNSHQTTSFFSETLNAVAAGSLLVMAVLSVLLFYGRVPHNLTWSIGIANLALSFYFAGAVGGLLGLDASMLSLHKLADVAVWLGIIFFFNGLRLTGVLPSSIYKVLLVNILLGVLVILFGTTGDWIQLGTTLPFGTTIGVILYSGYRVVAFTHGARWDRKTVFSMFSILTFFLAALNEIFVVTGISQGPTLFNLGCVGGLLFFALFVNERITQTYQERDYLRSNLELEVIKKTEELKRSQAELVQSSKLASLGTMAAGIAHEINNSLNYVNGAIVPFEKLVQNLPDEQKAKSNRLLLVMKDGLNLTFEIIKSLKTYTGWNQSKPTVVSLKELVNSTSMILRSKLKGKIEIIDEIDATTTIFGNAVGLHQVLINLLSNAVDALEEKGGKIFLRATTTDRSTTLEVEDTGCGIPSELLDKIFDPFFTTKEVGKGTGLGLHIIKKEMERVNGRLNVRSAVGKGTSFVLEFPNEGKSLPEAIPIKAVA